jgi:hypothetical protein
MDYSDNSNNYMRAGKGVRIWLSDPDYQYLKDNLISPTDLLRAAIRQVKSAPKGDISDNIT